MFSWLGMTPEKLSVYDLGIYYYDNFTNNKSSYLRKINEAC